MTGAKGFSYIINFTSTYHNRPPRAALEGRKAPRKDMARVKETSEPMDHFVFT